MTPGTKLVRGDVVQISPLFDPGMFGGAFMIVTDPKYFGAMGYVPMGVHMMRRNENESAPGAANVQLVAGQAFIRVPWEHMEIIGRAIWNTEDADSTDADDADEEHSQP